MGRGNLSHVGIYVHDVERMVDFYAEIFGLLVSDRGVGKTFRNELVFMSARAEQHHQLVIVSGRPAEATFSTIMQLSFKVDEIDDLRRAEHDALRLGATRMIRINHGNALSIYFGDPEGNTVEVYLDTPWYIAQPHADPLDLDLPDSDIWAQTESACRADATFMTVEAWQAKHFPSSRAD